MQIERKSFSVAEFKADEPTGTIEAIVSVFSNVDSGKERVLPGFFTKSLQQKLPKGVYMHDWKQPVAKTLEAKELMPGDPSLPMKLRELGGLYIKGQFNLDTQRGKEAFSDIKFGIIDEFSIGYSVSKETYDKKNGVRDLVEGRLFEWSPVLVGMNPETALLSAKSATGAEKQVSELETLFAALSHSAKVGLFYYIEDGEKKTDFEGLPDDAQGFWWKAALLSAELKAQWTRKYINSLPDASFAYIESGGEKDDEGKTKPRKLRHFPYKDADGKADEAHVRNALARIPQSKLADDAKSAALKKVQAAARKLGIKLEGDKSLVEQIKSIREKLNKPTITTEEYASLKQALDQLIAGPDRKGLFASELADRQMNFWSYTDILACAIDRLKWAIENSEDLASSPIDYEQELDVILSEFATTIKAFLVPVLRALAAPDDESTEDDSSDTQYAGFLPTRSKSFDLVSLKAELESDIALTDHSDKVESAAAEFVSQATALGELFKSLTDRWQKRADTRLKEGRVFSEANRKKLKELHAKMGEAHQQMGDLLDATEPKKSDEQQPTSDFELRLLRLKADQLRGDSAALGEVNA